MEEEPVYLHGWETSHDWISFKTIASYPRIGNGASHFIKFQVSIRANDMNDHPAHTNNPKPIIYYRFAFRRRTRKRNRCCSEQERFISTQSTSLKGTPATVAP